MAAGRKRTTDNHDVSDEIPSHSTALTAHRRGHVRRWRAAIGARILAALLLLSVTSILGATAIHYLDLQQAGNSAIIIQEAAGGHKVILVDAGKASVDASR